MTVRKGCYTLVTAFLFTLILVRLAFSFLSKVCIILFITNRVCENKKYFP